MSADAGPRDGGRARAKPRGLPAGLGHRRSPDPGRVVDAAVVAAGAEGQKMCAAGPTRLEAAE